MTEETTPPDDVPAGSGAFIPPPTTFQWPAMPTPVHDLDALADDDATDEERLAFVDAVAPAPDYGRTRSGEPITDELLEGLTAEAEEGFDVEEILRRRGDVPPGEQTFTRTDVITSFTVAPTADPAALAADLTWPDKEPDVPPDDDAFIPGDDPITRARELGAEIEALRAELSDLADERARAIREACMGDATQSEVAAALGITRARVSWIVHKGES